MSLHLWNLVCVINTNMKLVLDRNVQQKLFTCSLVFHLYAVRVLRGGGLSQLLYRSATELEAWSLDRTCWSWTVELLNAFLIFMS